MLPRVIFDPEINPGAENTPDAMHSSTSPARYCQHRSVSVLETTARYPVLWARSAFRERIHAGIGVHVARAGAVPQLAGRVLDIGIFALLVWPGLVIVGMTARTVRLERREPPGNEFGVCLMTLGALQVAAMVLRFVRQCHMAIVSRRPCVGDMAGIAFLDGAEVIRVRTDRVNPVVTRRTGTQHLVVIDSNYR